MSTATSGDGLDLKVFQATNLDEIMQAKMDVTCPVGCWLQIYLDLPRVLKAADLDPSLAEAWGFFFAGLDRKLQYRGVIQPQESEAILKEALPPPAPPSPGTPALALVENPPAESGRDPSHG